MEEDQDRALLTSLGVTSANPEDIERDILEEVKKNAGESSESGGNREEVIDGVQGDGTSGGADEDLYNKLRAVEVEIDAVKSAVDQLESLEENEDNDSGSDDGRKQEKAEVRKSTMPVKMNDTSLQHALAADRLESLMRRKSHLEKQIIDTPNFCKGEKITKDLVKEGKKHKRNQKEGETRSIVQKKRRKEVSIKEDDDFDAVLNAASAGFVETERDELVRKGILTPFHKLKGFEKRIQEAGPTGTHNELDHVEDDIDRASSSIARAARAISEAARARPTTKLVDPGSLPQLEGPTRPFQRLGVPLKISESQDSDEEKKRKRRRPLPGKRWRKLASKEDASLQGLDRNTSSMEDDDEDVPDVDAEGPTFVTLEGGLKIPETIFSKLFDYQKVGVQWLWELHCQRAGGIIGDEMGLGKTVQVLAFLGSLHFSGMYKPSIIICPVTLLRQWKREAQKWYPGFHVEILHDSAQDQPARKKREKSYESDYESDELLESDCEGRKASSKNINKWDSLLNHVWKSESGLLITTYEQLRLLGEKLLDIEWGYAVLDEGHRIRNPNAEITLVCKQLQTVHRIIMTGAPIQNKLSELWSLFDFVFPGKLGVLPVFEAEFAVPISVGGYANASPLQVSTAYRCAVVLRDLIMPYLLRRMKSDVNAHLPKKTEHVLFCSLTPEQRSVYRAFLASSEVERILDGNKNSLYGIDVVRKICNHPDLLEREHAYNNPDYGNPERSGKMKVVAQVLKVWKDQGHRVLLFTQTQQMLDILENFLVAENYSYRRMDGLTPVKQRMPLIDEFNYSNDVFVFILTTKVGGLGTNLTGANRVIIFDPDWNPSTDMQARERAWRIGQQRDVTIYRLITRGTIEEKVYHRQIYKHFLTNKILKNPQQRRFFKARDMQDLFTLNDGEQSGSTETSDIFSQLAEEVNVVGAHEDAKKNSQSMRSSAVIDSTLGTGTDTDDIRKGKDKVEGSDGEVNEETNILRSLFDAQGIHSAMNHDVIMNAHDEEKLKLDEQASQVAQKAAEALRQSRMLCNQESITIPTWTGRAGSAGAPSSVRKKFGSTVNSQLASSSKPPGEVSNSESGRTSGLAVGSSSGKALSSADLLARIRGNKESAVSDALEHQLDMASRSSRGVASTPNRPHRLSSSSRVQPEVLIRQICTFMQRQGGSASSATIVDHFKERIPSEDLPLFKNLLKEIATLEKNSNGSFWNLKPEFQ
ncbi:damaged DNA-binding protein [Lithospermum erythrorhizon]|uniref:Damaged DNA-binding protein n=1 Tax=Lithospermum erythrorhizon TaxID=34254 RepID=A0AAV3NXU7_LITER